MAFVRPKSIGLFSYSKLKTRLYLEEKSLEITFVDDYFSSEMFFELESLLSWCKVHVEVHSIIFQGNKNQFSNGFNKEEIQNIDEEKLSRLQNKFENILTSMRELSQVLVMNLGNGAYEQGLELALHGDVLLVNDETKLSFNPLEYGLVPSFSTTKILGETHLKKMLFSPHSNLYQNLNDLGFLEIINKEQTSTTIESYKNHAKKLSAIARHYLKKSMRTEESTTIENINSNDYKNKEGEFKNLHQFIYT